MMELSVVIWQKNLAHLAKDGRTLCDIQVPDDRKEVMVGDIRMCKKCRQVRASMDGDPLETKE